MNICRIANTNYSNSLVKIMMAGSYKLSFFVCVVRGQIARWFVRRAKTILLIILAQLKLFCQQKMGKQKLQWAIFSVRLFAPIFFESTFVGRKSSEFFEPRGSKKGCNPQPSAERFTFVRHAVVSKVQKRYSLPKSNRNSLLYPDFGL